MITYIHIRNDLQKRKSLSISSEPVEPWEHYPTSPPVSSVSPRASMANVLSGICIHTLNKYIVAKNPAIYGDQQWGGLRGERGVVVALE